MTGLRLLPDLQQTRQAEFESLIEGLPREIRGPIERLLRSFERTNPTIDEKIELVNFLIQVSSTYENEARELINSLMYVVLNPNFRLEMLNENLVRGLLAVHNSIEEALGEDTHTDRDKDEIFDSLIVLLRYERFDLGWISEENAAAFGDAALLFWEETDRRPERRDVFAMLEFHPEMLFDLRNIYEDGLELGDEIGIQYFAETMNLGWAIGTIGLERTRYLHETMGIIHFARYSEEMLLEVYENMRQSIYDERPVLLVIFGRADSWGTLYTEGHQLHELGQNYRILIAEADCEEKFYSTITSVAESYGQIDTLVTAAHGTETSLKLGWGGERAEIDITDEEELERIRGAFTDTPTIILAAACNTGALNWGGIAAALSWSLNARVFAPADETFGTSYILGIDGIITNVRYKFIEEWGPAGIFEYGEWQRTE